MALTVQCGSPAYRDLRVATFAGLALMIRRYAERRFLTAGQGRLAVSILAMTFARAAAAGDGAADPAGQTWHHDFDAASTAPVLTVPLATPESLAASAIIAETDDEGANSAGSAAPAQELAARLDVRVEQKRRKFRTSAVTWMEQRSVAMGRMTDFLLGGADSGWHLVVDPTGADEYMLQWKFRFR
jgi:hypothetical protein